MRGNSQSFKNTSKDRTYQIKQSQQVMDQIGRIKQTTFSPYTNHQRLSDSRPQIWQQYLPNSNHRNQSISEDIRSDHYRYSLQRKLERLFVEEREMLKQRNGKAFTNQNEYRNHSLYSRGSKGSVAEQSTAISKMDSKIRQLEEKYRQQIHKQLRQSSCRQASTQCHIENNKQNCIQQANNPIVKDRVHFEQQSAKNRRALTQNVEECIQREEALKLQVQNLKKEMELFRLSSQQLYKKVKHREQRRKYKHRTKQLLNCILKKLEFINIDLEKSKKIQPNNQKGQKDRILNVNNIVEEFSQLQAQYRQLEDQRAQVHQKQLHLQKQITKISHQSEYSCNNI